MSEFPISLLVWGTLVGLDLTTVPQIGISRPIVAAAVAGALTGDVASGLLVGVVLELYALDFLPVGAARYPDYGLGAIPAVIVVEGSPAFLGLGVAIFVGLVTAYLAGKSVDLVRTSNTSAAIKHAAKLDAGEYPVVARLHAAGLLRDALRSLLVTLLGVSLAIVVQANVVLSTRAAVLVTMVAVGAALAASVGGAINVAGRKPGLIRYLIGLAVGIMWVIAA